MWTTALCFRHIIGWGAEQEFSTRAVLFFSAIAMSEQEEKQDEDIREISRVFYTNHHTKSGDNFLVLETHPIYFLLHLS